jgi:hypothetical protein
MPKTMLNVLQKETIKLTEILVFTLVLQSNIIAAGDTGWIIDTVEA